MPFGAATKSDWKGNGNVVFSVSLEMLASASSAIVCVIARLWQLTNTLNVFVLKARKSNHKKYIKNKMLLKIKSNNAVKYI